MKIFKLLNKASSHLLKIFGDKKLAYGEAVNILLSILKIPKERLYSNLRLELNKKTIQNFLKKISKRKKGYPTQYLTNYEFFYNRRFIIRRGVFIPRPETETLIDAAKKAFIKKCKNCLDIGCGSGCLGTTIKLEIPHIKKITFIDYDKTAINNTKDNVKYYNLQAKIIHSCFFKYISKHKIKYDAAICNPPYIAPQEYKKLQKEVKYEPKTALLAKNNGYHFYIKLNMSGNMFLKHGGYLILESGNNIADDIKKIFKSNWNFLFGINDFYNIERALVFQLRF